MTHRSKLFASRCPTAGAGCAIAAATGVASVAAPALSKVRRAGEIGSSIVSSPYVRGAPRLDQRKRRSSRCCDQASSPMLVRFPLMMHTLALSRDQYHQLSTAPFCQHQEYLEISNELTRNLQGVYAAFICAA